LIRDRRALEASGAYPDLPDARRDHDVAVLGGLIALAAGFEEGDAVAAILVAGIIFAAASRLIDENARVLMDTSPADARAKAEAAISGLGEAVGWV
jgi:divalent metal cation (Fe/Co/Zn/Cd) transporter